MNDFKTPERFRKTAAQRSPCTPSNVVNEYLIGKSRAMRLVASVERAGHQTVIAQLNKIRRSVPLTTGQARAVLEELQWRTARVRQLTQMIDYCQRSVDYQLAKPSAPENIPRSAALVPGPNGSKFRQGPSGGTQTVIDREPPGPPGTNHVRHSTFGMPKVRTAHMKIDMTAKASWFPGVSASLPESESEEVHDGQD